MLTFDSARFHYSQYRLFLAVDADEILIPASSRGFALSGFKKELRGIFSKQALRDKEEFVFFRCEGCFNFRLSVQISVDCIYYIIGVCESATVFFVSVWTLTVSLLTCVFCGVLCCAADAQRPP